MTSGAGAGILFFERRTTGDKGDDSWSSLNTSIRSATGNVRIAFSPKRQRRRREIVQHIAQADLFVLPSDRVHVPMDADVLATTITRLFDHADEQRVLYYVQSWQPACGMFSGQALAKHHDSVSIFRVRWPRPISEVGGQKSETNGR